MRQVVAAVKYAHAHGIAHRDLKPENVCFCSSAAAASGFGDVKVVDWGAAFRFREAPMRTAIGSVAYSAPELSKPAEGYTEACDLWSLGVTAYVALCGKPPFWGDHQNQLRCMKDEQYPLDEAPWDKISGDAKGWVRSLLRADPAHRLAAAAALEHPWLKRPRGFARTPLCARDVFSTIRDSASYSATSSLFAALVAKQLDHQSLQQITKIFRDLDADGNGSLALGDLRRGFEEAFGADGVELRDVAAVFQHMNLAGTGSVGYTEFCAAALWRSDAISDEALRVAFREFDRNDKVKKELAACAPASCDIPVRDSFSQEFRQWLAKAGRRPSASHRQAERAHSKSTCSLWSRACSVVTGRGRSGNPSGERTAREPSCLEVAWGEPAAGLLLSPFAV
uniref:Non-specific serine/threonine protein kinase n=1 Tax=Zooxanthella nutricula TaxID=1333877 RepID=A0A7S2QBT0_9DINO